MKVLASQRFSVQRSKLQWLSVCSQIYTIILNVFKGFGCDRIDMVDGVDFTLVVFALR